MVGTVCARQVITGYSNLSGAIADDSRITSLDSNRPLIIHEDSCDLLLPSTAEDRLVQQQSQSRIHSSQSKPPTGSLAVIHITRLHAQVSQALKFSTILPQALQSLDEKFRAKAMLLPESYRNGSHAPLDTTAIPPLFALLSAQFHLYRRNMTPICRPPERAEALSRCVSVAQDTARYISRIMHTPANQKTQLALIASNTICLHMWRCMLVLCFRGDYDAALMCLHLSSAIGSTRKINTECGKNIVFFLEELLGRVRNGNGSPQQLEHDEEILAYVSADAQGNTEHAWAWGRANASSPASRPDEPMRDALPLRMGSSPVSPREGPAPWDEWGRIEHLVRQLMEENRPRNANYYPAQHNPVKRVQLAPDTMKSNAVSAPSAPVQSSSSRISIANII